MWKEQWRWIKGYKDLYQISNYGNIKSFCQNKGGKIRKAHPNGKQGRFGIILYKAPHKPKHYLIHRLVLEAFVGPCPDNMECCHKDGNMGNNYVGNLRWDTRFNNAQDKYKHGTVIQGENSKLAKLTNQQVLEIVEVLKEKQFSHIEIARQYNVSPSIIGHIASGDSWQWLTNINKNKKLTKSRNSTKYERYLIRINYYKVFQDPVHNQSYGNINYHNRFTTQAILAKEFEFSQPGINKILNNDEKFEVMRIRR